MSGKWVDYHPTAGDGLPGARKQPFRAECQLCPWKGPVRYDSMTALADGAMHSRKEHPNQKVSRGPGFGG